MQPVQADHYRVLVVEDEGVQAFMLGRLLTEMGHEVCSIVGTESAAIAAAARFEPTMMIIDDRLGEGSGAAALFEILRVRAIAHVLVSGDQTRARPDQPGTVILRKPFTELQLARAMKQARQPGMLTQLKSRLDVQPLPLTGISKP